MKGLDVIRAKAVHDLINQHRDSLVSWQAHHPAESYFQECSDGWFLDKTSGTLSDWGH